MIIGRDIMHSLGINLLFDTAEISWENAKIHMQHPERLKDNWVGALEQEILYAHDPEPTDAERIQGIIESKYTPADLSKIVEECTHLEQAERRQLLHLLQKYEEWPMRKRRSLVTQTPLMSPLMSWNRVKGFLAIRDMRSVLSDFTPGVIKSTSKILIQIMIAKCLLKSAVKNLNRSLIPWTRNPLRRLMKMRTSKQAKRKRPSSSLLTKRRTVKLTLIE
jgi:hypothetical protein